MRSLRLLGSDEVWDFLPHVSCPTVAGAAGGASKTAWPQLTHALRSRASYLRCSLRLLLFCCGPKG